MSKTAKKTAAKKSAPRKTAKPEALAKNAPVAPPKPGAPKTVELPANLKNVKRVRTTVNPALLTENPFVLKFLPLTESDVQLVAENLNEEGQHYPILVANDDVIIDGHKRRAAALALGLDEVMIEKLDVSSNDPRAIDLAFALNFVRAQHSASVRRKVGHDILSSNPEWSNGRIAARCGVSVETVRLWRGELERQGKIEKQTKVVDTTGREIDVTSIGAKSKERAKPNFPNALLRLPEADMLTPTQFTEEQIEALLSWHVVLSDLIADLEQASKKTA